MHTKHTRTGQNRRRMPSSPPLKYMRKIHEGSHADPRHDCFLPFFVCFGFPALKMYFCIFRISCSRDTSQRMSAESDVRTSLIQRWACVLGASRRCVPKEPSIAEQQKRERAARRAVVRERDVTAESGLILPSPAARRPQSRALRRRFFASSLPNRGQRPMLNGPVWSM